MIKYLKTGAALHSDKYRPDLDGLRAIAVSVVVLSHSFPRVLPGGFIGVDIFFVISGYLISSILIKEFRNDAFSILKFYDRRIRRIFPALIVVLLFLSVCGWICLFEPEYFVLGRHIITSALFSENLLLWGESGYFDVSSELKPTLHLWSLAIEEQFYIIWPALMYLMYLQRINFMLVFVVLTVVSFVITLHYVYTDPTSAYYSPLGRSWELMIGSCLAYLHVSRPELLARYKSAQSFAGLLLVVVALIFMRADNGFRGFWALLPTMGSFLLISSGEKGWVNRRLLGTAPMVWCGLISYPLYLWHWPFLSFGYITSGYLSAKIAFAGIMAAVVAATLTFFFIERPFRRHGEGPAKTLFLMGAMAATLGFGVLIMTRVISPRLIHFDAPTRTIWDFLKDRTADFDKNGVGIYTLEGDRPSFVLFVGDSHVAQYAVRVNKVIAGDAERPGAILAVGGGCIPIEGVTTKDLSRTKCWPMRNEAYRMAEESRVRTIVIGGAWNDYFEDSDYTYEVEGKRIPLDTPEGRQAALDRLGQRIKALIQAGKHVIFILDNPQSLGFDPRRRAIRLSLANNLANEMVKIDPRQLELRRLLLDWVNSQGAGVIDPYSALCTADVCRETDATGLPLYEDPDHFNPDWAIDHAEFIDLALGK